METKERKINASYTLDNACDEKLLRKAVNSDTSKPLQGAGNQLAMMTDHQQV